MKKFLFSVFAILLSIVSFAQINQADRNTALSLIKSNLKQIGLSENDYNNLDVSSTYLIEQSNIRMVYLIQTFKGIQVFNKMQVLAFKNGSLVSATGGRVGQIEQLVNVPSATPLIDATQALATVLADQQVLSNEKIVPVKQVSGKTYFGKLNVSNVDISAELVWLPINNKEIRLTWQIEIAPLKTSDHYLIRVDALTNRVIDKNNYTVYEQFEQLKSKEQVTFENALNNTADNQSPNVVTSATMRVIPYPAESPIHAGGAHALVTDPWTWAPGNATSLLWNYDGTAYRDSTRGNNVWAQEDRDNNNATYGKAAVSSTPQPSLTINYTPDYTQAPTIAANQGFATANLFYWNNLMHDLLYKYGFDEVSGNFQANNQSRGGVGNDYVVADAQDAGGTNNANFSTPVDGSLPRMQMYIFNYTTPNRDGDLDNGIITHEYGHGLSNRLTGGPANSSCLSNAEQGGEGWSDYMALMTSTDWTTATVNDGSLSRAIGTYVLGQAITGTGIRTYPYSTNMSVNPWTYGMMAGSGGEVHKIGEIWCAVLWDMTWELIAVDGINRNFFDPIGIGGNSAAMKLVLEGMRLQPCSPGYIDARNAILKADTLFFGAKYSCAIWKAFARRGMGKFASQGSSSSTTDQVADYTDNGGSSFLLTQSLTQQQEGQNVTYNHYVSAGNCGAISNYTIRDTLPSNVTYVSGGTYDATTRVVSFAVNLALGASQNYAYTVSINQGSYYAPIQLIDESVPTTTISSSWTKTSTTTTNWVASSAQSTSAPNSLFAQNLATTSDIKLETTTGITLPSTPMNLTFQGYINAESGYDGGVVEISTNNGTSWTDLGSKFTSGGYSGTLASFLSTNPLGGRSAFTGNSGGFVKSVINLASYAGQTIKIRFRFGSDGSAAATGWYVDDIQLKDVATVVIKSALYNSINARVATSDTFTIINQTTACIPGAISTQPANFNTCLNGNAQVSVAATGSGLTYQWKVSNDAGLSFTDVAGATSASLSLTSVTADMNSNQYQCLINGTCTTDLLSNAAVLSITASPNAPTVSDVSRCGTGTVTLSGAVSTNETIDWYSATTGGTLVGSGVSITSPSISTTTTYYAQTRNTVTSCLAQSRSILVANVLATPSAPIGTGASICGSGTATLSATPGANQVIDWYSASTGGSLLLAGSNTYTTPSLTVTTTYYATSRNASCSAATRTAVAATVNALPAAVTTVVNATKCGTDTSTISATASTGFTINWYADSTKLTLLQSGTVTGVNKFITPAVSSTTLYWAVQKSLTNGCLSAASKRVTTTINPRPAAPSATPGSRCGTGTVVLRAVAPTSPVGTLAWYSVATGGTSLSTATSYTTPSLTTTTNYYVEAKTTSTACVSATRTVVPATINAIPAVPTAVGGSRCGTGTVVISAIPATGLTVDWYSAATGGTALLTGNTTYTTPSLTATRSYYATSRNATTTCVSTTRRAVTASITSVLAAPTSLTGTTSICSIVGTATGATYTTTAVTGATNYAWTIPSGAVIDSGSNGLKIKVRFITAGANDSIFVQANNGCLGAKRVLKLVTTGCATTPFVKNGIGAGQSAGLQTNANNLGLSLYPNPTSTVIHMKLLNSSNEIAELKIMDLEGRVIRTYHTRSAETETFGNDLKPGVYFIKVTQGTQWVIKRFVKM
jgi:extracellular elastinolytic metalloproteinase